MVEVCRNQFVHNDLREYDSDEDGNDDGNDLPSVTLFGDDGGDDHPPPLLKEMQQWWKE